MGISEKSEQFVRQLELESETETETEVVTVHNQWPRQRDVKTFYSNPDKNQDGRADASWEAANLVKIVPPYQLYYPSDNEKNVRQTPFKGLWIHGKCADSLLRCLAGIKREFTEDEIRKFQLDVCGGTYVFRVMRGGQALSMHSYGCAIDLSHVINYYKRKYDESKGMMPMRAVKIFQAEGWTWGGLWSTADAMHFQAASV